MATAAAQHFVKKSLGPSQVVGIVCGCVLAFILVVYCVGCLFFYQRFWPNTVIGSTDVSMMTASDAVVALEQTSAQRTVTVEGQGVAFTLTSSNAGLAFNSDAAVQQALTAQKVWMWPMEISMAHDESDVLKTSYDAAALTQAVTDGLAGHNSVAESPTDAFVYYDDAANAFQINPGAAGTMLSVDHVVATVSEALAADTPHVALSSADLVPQTLTADSPVLQQSAQTANSYLACDLNLTVGGTPVAYLNADAVRQMVVFGADGSVALDDGLLTSWVNLVEAHVDNVGAARSYTRPDGKAVSVTGGTYGWISDGDALDQIVRDAIANGTVGDQEIPFSQTADVYNPGGADWAGRYIDVDLTEQHVRFYDAYGSIIWESDCVSGATDGEHETPTGVYYVNNKALHQTLLGQTDPTTNQPEYQSEVTYWMPFYGNLVGLHDASWQAAFGGTRNQEGYGSHGCVNLPTDAAASLYDIISIGDVVVVHY